METMEDDNHLERCWVFVNDNDSKNQEGCRFYRCSVSAFCSAI